MDFVMGLPRTLSGYDSTWVVGKHLYINPLISSPFDPITKCPSQQISISEILSDFMEFPLVQFSDREPKFTSRFWRALHLVLGSQLNVSTAYHPQKVGQTKRTIQTLEDMLRACVLDSGGRWEEYLPLVEFTKNNRYHSLIGMTPYEALYVRKCRTPLCCLKSVKEGFQDQIQFMRPQRRFVLFGRGLNSSMSCKSYVHRRTSPLEFSEGDRVFLKFTHTIGIGRALQAKKLSPRFIGPFQIIERIGPVVKYSSTSIFVKFS